MFRTPNLHHFLVTWYVSPQQLPMPLNNEEFLAERFLEDLMDEDTSINLVVLEVHCPNMDDYRIGVDRDVAVELKILATEEQAREVVRAGYKVKPDKPQDMKGRWDDPGRNWGELQKMIAHDISSGELSAFSEALFTDDSDPDAPWYRARYLKLGTRGWYLTLEEVE